MLLKQYLSILPSKNNLLILRILIGFTIFWHTVPRALAQEANVTTNSPICQEEQVEERYLKPSAKKMQKLSKPPQRDGDEENSEKNGEFCQPSETPKVTSEESFNDFSTGTDPYADSAVTPEIPAAPSPSISNQDSHDLNLNFSIHLNSGGGTSSDGNESFPESDSPSPTEPESTSDTGEVDLPATRNHSRKSSKFPSAHLKAPRKKLHKPKANKLEQHKPRKLRQNNKLLKRDRLKRLHHKPNKPFLKKPNRINKPVQRIKTIHRKPIKNFQNLKIRDKSYRDKLPPIRRKPNTRKVHPLFRPGIRPHRVYKPTVPQFRRIHRHVR
jgi:hypothetical protein